MKETRERMWMLLRDTDFLFYFLLIVSGLSRVGEERSTYSTFRKYKY